MRNIKGASVGETVLNAKTPDGQSVSVKIVVEAAPVITSTAVWSDETTTTTTTDYQEPEMYGDANGDGEIKLNDAVLIMQALSNPNKFGIDGTDELHITADGWANADCNNPGDGVTGKDALAIQKFMLSLIESLPEQ